MNGKPNFFRKGFNNRKKEREHRLNEEIKHRTVRIVGEGVESKVCDISEALRISKGVGVDLVEVVTHAQPPVCRVIDYQKFLYEKKKKEKDINKGKKSEVKEVRLSQNIGEHDFNFKAKHAEEFLKDGDKVKVAMRFKGRSIVFKNQGEMVMAKFALALEEFGKVEQLPKMEGKNMYMFIVPKKKG
jgi:translation initiation factor IF-3